SLEAMQRLTAHVSKDLRAIKGVRNFGSHIGRAEVADEVVGPNFTELWISVDRNVDLDKAQREIEAVVESYPGLYRDVLTYLKEVIKEVLTGAKATIVVRVYGPALAELRQKAQQVFNAIAEVEGVHTPRVEPQTLVPQVQVRPRPDALARFGLTPGQVRRAVQTLVRGTQVGEVYHGQKSFPVVGWRVPAVRHDLWALRKLPIDLPAGAATASTTPVSTGVNGAHASPGTAALLGTQTGHVLLGDVADVEIVPAPNEILREGAS